MICGVAQRNLELADARLRTDNSLRPPRHSKQQQGERKKQEIANAADPDRDVDGESDAARDRETRGEHAGCAVDSPQPRSRLRINRIDQPHACRKAESHEQPGGENNCNAPQGAHGKCAADADDRYAAAVCRPRRNSA
jgi:hypothetical protein